MNADQWASAKGLLAEACDLPASDREAFLLERCRDQSVRVELLQMAAAPAPLSDILLRAALSAGESVGPYVIEGLLGAGGMGEVYRARDTKLNRDVAIKVLPSLLAGDPDRRTRLKREAQTLAALNHPTSRRSTASRSSATPTRSCLNWWKARRWRIGWRGARSPSPRPSALRARSPTPSERRTIAASCTAT